MLVSARAIERAECSWRFLTRQLEPQFGGAIGDDSQRLKEMTKTPKQAVRGKEVNTKSHGSPHMSGTRYVRVSSIDVPRRRGMVVLEFDTSTKQAAPSV